MLTKNYRCTQSSIVSSRIFAQLHIKTNFEAWPSHELSLVPLTELKFDSRYNRALQNFASRL